MMVQPARVSHSNVSNSKLLTQTSTLATHWWTVNRTPRTAIAPRGSHIERSSSCLNSTCDASTSHRAVRTMANSCVLPMGYNGALWLHFWITLWLHWWLKSPTGSHLPVSREASEEHLFAFGSTSWKVCDRARECRSSVWWAPSGRLILKQFDSTRLEARRVKLAKNKPSTFPFLVSNGNFQFDSKRLTRFRSSSRFFWFAIQKRPFSKSARNRARTSCPTIVAS